MDFEKMMKLIIAMQILFIATIIIAIGVVLFLIGKWLGAW